MASTTSRRSPATRPATSTSTRECSGSGSWPRRSTRTSPTSTTCSLPARPASPGSELTFFEYPGAIPGQPGEGMVHRIVSRVGSPEALDFWVQRLGDLGVPVSAPRAACASPTPRGWRTSSSCRHGRRAAGRAAPRHPAEHALGGFEGVRAYSGRPERSAALLERVLGATPAGDATWELRGERRGGTIAYDPSPRAGRQSAGTRAPRRLGHDGGRAPAVARAPGGGRRAVDAGDRPPLLPLDLLPRAAAACCSRSPTTAPGFTVDGPVEELGTKIILPPFLESRRAEIEARLTPLPDPRARSAS